MHTSLIPKSGWKCFVFATCIGSEHAPAGPAPLILLSFSSSSMAKTSKTNLKTAALRTGSCSQCSVSANLTAAMPDKRMRPIVKQEPGADGAQELPPPPQAAAAAAAAEAQAFALQGIERERSMAEQLLQAKAQVAELLRHISHTGAAVSRRPLPRFALSKLDIVSCSGVLCGVALGSTPT